MIDDRGVDPRFFAPPQIGADIDAEVRPTAFGDA